jgi:hypothetical protein
MISDLVMDATLQAHYEVQKLSVLCDVCHTRYVLDDVIHLAQYHSDANGLVYANEAVARVSRLLRVLRFIHQPSHSCSAHATGSNESANPTASRPPSPSIEGKQSTPTGSVSGASTGPTNGKSDGVVYFECLGCKRQVSRALCVHREVESPQHV